MCQWRSLCERGEHLSNNFDVRRNWLFAGVSQLADVLLEELLLSVIMTVSVGGGETVRSVAYFFECLLAVHNSNFINITND